MQRDALHAHALRLGVGTTASSLYAKMPHLTCTSQHALASLVYSLFSQVPLIHSFTSFLCFIPSPLLLSSPLFFSFPLLFFSPPLFTPRRTSNSLSGWVALSALSHRASRGQRRPVPHPKSLDQGPEKPDRESAEHGTGDAHQASENAERETSRAPELCGWNGQLVTGTEGEQNK